MRNLLNRHAETRIVRGLHSLTEPPRVYHGCVRAAKTHGEMLLDQVEKENLERSLRSLLEDAAVYRH